MRIAFVLIACWVAIVPQVAFGQASAELVGPSEAIPDAPYKTWTLFLICAPDWVAPDRSAELADLYHRFHRFGDAIGDDNLAVWFWKQRMSVADPKLSENVDVARSAEYCRALKLAPSEGPYLVVTSAHPTLPNFPADRAVYALGALQPSELGKLLNALTDQLLLHGRVDAGGGAGSVGTPSSAFWIRLLEGAQRSMVGFGCRLKLQINTGVLSAELRECAK